MTGQAAENLESVPYLLGVLNSSTRLSKECFAGKADDDCDEAYRLGQCTVIARCRAAIANHFASPGRTQGSETATRKKESKERWFLGEYQ